MKKFLVTCFIFSTSILFPCDECIQKIEKEMTFLTAHQQSLMENCENDCFDVHSFYYIKGLVEGLGQARDIMKQTHTP